MKKSPQFTVAARQTPGLAVKASWSQETVYPKVWSPKQKQQPGQLTGSAAPGTTLSSVSAPSPGRRKRELKGVKTTTVAAAGAPLQQAQVSPNGGVSGEGDDAPVPDVSRLAATRHKVTKFHKLLDEMLSEVRMQYPHLPPSTAQSKDRGSSNHDEDDESQHWHDEDVDKVAAELISQAWNKLCRVRECYQMAYARAYDQLHDMLNETNAELQQITIERDEQALILERQAVHLDEFSQELDDIVPDYLRARCTRVSSLEDMQDLVILLGSTLKQRDELHERTVADLDRQVRSLRKRIAQENFAYLEPVAAVIETGNDDIETTGS